MPSFGWKAPFPIRFGGSSSRQIDGVYNALRDARPGPLRQDGGAADIEDQAAARGLAVAYRAVRRRVAEADPRALSSYVRPVNSELKSTLERWEHMLGIVPEDLEDLANRRRVVSTILTKFTSNTISNVGSGLNEILGGWYQGYDVIDLSTVTTSATVRWPGANGTTERPGTAAAEWTSEIAIFVAYYQAPANTPAAELNRRTREASNYLDGILPAWMGFSVQPALTVGGFTLDVDLLNFGEFLCPTHAFVPAGLPAPNSQPAKWLASTRVKVLRGPLTAAEP